MQLGKHKGHYSRLIWGGYWIIKHVSSTMSVCGWVISVSLLKDSAICYGDRLNRGDLWRWFSYGDSVYLSRNNKFNPNRPNGFVWIELIVAETENWNWKYCSKIIFKYVNSIVRPIFNEKVVKKWYLWVP